MASSRKPALTESRADLVSSALRRWLDAHATPAGLPNPRWAIAFSGGRDSTVLLHALAQQLPGSQLAALHVNHGLQVDAQAWQQHCRALCAVLGIPFFTRTVTVPRDSGLGIEAAARTARYAALVEMAHEAGCTALLTAHHADDQVESVLLQLLRGTGLPGAAGMAASKLVVDASFPQHRPLLEVPAAAMADYAAEFRLQWIDDPSNQNTHYARNALRHSVLPALQEYFPDYRTTLTRFAHHAAEAQTLLNQLAHLDYVQCVHATGPLHVPALLQLSGPRQTNLLRYWLGLHQLAAPSAARLHEVLRRLHDAKLVRAWSVEHDGHEIRFEYDRLTVRAVTATPPPVESIDFRWQGESSIAMPAWGGSWHFIPAQQGIDTGWLRQQTLSTRPRLPGAKLKLHPHRPSRSLKNLYQEAQIAHDQRARLPLLFAGDALLAAAGIGTSCDFDAAGAKARVRLAWGME